MEHRLCKFCFLMSCILALCLADDLKSSSTQGQSSVAHRAKRSKVIGDYGTAVCNRTVWKAVFEPYLRAEARYQRNATEEMKTRYNVALARVNNWKNKTISSNRNLAETCGLLSHLECGEQSRCICGTGGVPYSYVTKNGGVCRAKRGSHCLDESDCDAGLLCQDRYCGGAAAFLEEYAKLTEIETEPEKDTASLVSANLALFCSFLITVILRQS